MKYRNPIIPGFNPDPSVCRVGDTFYLVTSSFEFFPGVPIYSSKNLINWEQIGHVLDRESQLPLTGAILSEKKYISHGSGGFAPEAPHIYKINGWYYLMMAEGGTEFGHMETIARSKKVDGPYEFCPDGPILTCSGYYGAGNPIQCTGHADLFDDENGNWWIVMLGTRPIGPRIHHLGRETFLAPVTWKDGWPCLENRGVMQMTVDAALPAADTVTAVSDNIHVDFTAADSVRSLPKAFTWLRNPIMENYVIDNGLLLRGTDQRLSTPNTSPSWIGIRQTQMRTVTTAVLKTDLAENTTAGLSAYAIHSHHYDVLLTRRYGKLYAQLRKHLYDLEAVTCELPLPACETVTLKITSDRNTYTFAAVADNGPFVTLGTALTAGLATEVTEMMTFTGTFLALFAENGEARFTSFDYDAEWVDGFN